MLLYGKPPITTANSKLERITLEKTISIIKNDTELKKATAKIRAAGEPDKAGLKKSILPYVLPFNYSILERNSKNFVSSSYMFFEADHVSNLEQIIKQVIKDKNIAMLYRSVSGDGFKILIQLDTEIKDEKMYLRVYNVLRAEFNKTFNITLDPSSKDIARVQFLAHDPKAYFNKKHALIKATDIINRLKILDEIPVDRTNRSNELIYNDKDIKKAITYIRNHGYLDEKNEWLWWELSMSLASLGEAGREYFILLSSDNPMYPGDTLNKLNKRFDKFIEAWGNYHDENRVLNMNAFFNIIEKVYNFKAPKADTTEGKSIELILADKFVERFKDTLLYDHSKSGKAKTYGWHIWDGKAFRLSQKGEISDYYLKLIREEKQLSIAAAKQEDIKDPDNKPLPLSQIARAETRRYRDLTLTWAGEREGLGILPDDLDNNVELFNVLNGVLNLRTGKLLEHSPSFRITKLSNTIYQKNAKCPMWENFILKISYGSEEMARYIQEAVGYSLTGYTSEQCLFFLYGIGANGKSTFLEGLKLIMGEYQIHSNYETFTALNRDGNSHSEDIVRLKGARLVVSSEIAANRSLNESMIKQITSGDIITARDLHSSSIEFKPTFKLWIAGNHKPKIQNFDHGIKRRIFIMPFEHIFSKKDMRPQYEVIEEFKSEQSGILNWALEGAQRYFKNKKLTVPKIVMDTTREYFLESNIIEQFINERCAIGDKINAEAKDILNAYYQYTDAINEERLGRNQFYKRLEELGYKRAVSASQSIIFKGIALKDTIDVFKTKKRTLPA